MLSSFNTVLFDLPPICVLPTMKFCFIMDAETRGHKTMDLSEAQSLSKFFFLRWLFNSVGTNYTNIKFPLSTCKFFFPLHLHKRNKCTVVNIYVKLYTFYLYLLRENYFSILWKLLTYIKNECLKKDCLQ